MLTQRIGRATAGILVVVVGGIGAVAVRHFSGRSDITNDERRFDAGVVNVGDTIVHDFEVGYTPGHKPTLGLPLPYCGCTSAEVLQTSAGASSTHLVVRVTVRTEELGAQPIRNDAPPMTQVVEIPTDDKAQPRLIFSIGFKPKNQFKLSDQAVEFGVVRAGHPVTKTIAIDELTEDRVLGATSTDPGWTAAVSRSSSSDNRTLLTVSENIARTGHYMGSILVATSSKSMPVLRIFVSTTIE